MKYIVLVAFVSLTCACSNSGDDATSSAIRADYVTPPPSASYAEAQAAAVAAIENSAALGHAWSTSEVLLEKAAAAAAEGDEVLAVQFADKARMQADLSALQAAHEKEVWMERVLSD